MSDIDTGDTVRHIPSDESWIVAFVEGGKLCACGWPCSLVPVSECVLIEKATPEARLKLLNDMASMKSSDPRREHARRALCAGASESTEAAPLRAHPAAAGLVNRFASHCAFLWQHGGCTPLAAAQSQSASTEHRDALMKLSQFAHTAAHMSARDASNNLLSIADQLIALASAPAAIPAAPSEALMPSRMEVDSWRRSLLTWREASPAELIENTAGLKQCLSNAARLLLDHPALAQPAPVQPLIDWVVERWHAEVKNRPMVNIHRRSLDDTWRQVLRHLGVDDRARLGPTHDELRAEIGSKEWEAMNGKAAPVQQEADAAPAADAPPLKGLAHFHYRLEAASGYEQEGVYNNITADGFGRVIAALEDAREDGRAALQPTQSAAPMPWPKARDVGRLGDMSPTASMRVGLDSDNDVYVAVYGDDGGGSVEFCTPGSGGGQSPRVREALIALMVAMEEENATSPHRDWWARRNTQGTGSIDHE